jgi:heme A synthase
MELFRRPLGVLIGALTLGVLCLAIAKSNQDSNGDAVGVLGLVGVIGLYVALGALAVIVWRLIRKPTA